MPIISRSRRAVLKHIATLARYSYFENYSAAERLLNEVKDEIRRRGVWGEGCYAAARGMIAAGREGAPITFFWKVRNADLKSLAGMRESIVKDLARENIDDFEAGFLHAWLTIIDTIIQVKKSMKGVR